MTYARCSSNFAIARSSASSITSICVFQKSPVLGPHLHASIPAIARAILTAAITAAGRIPAEAASSRSASEPPRDACSQTPGTSLYCPGRSANSSRPSWISRRNSVTIASAAAKNSWIRSLASRSERRRSRRSASSARFHSLNAKASVAINARIERRPWFASAQGHHVPHQAWWYSSAKVASHSFMAELCTACGGVQ